MTIKLFCVECQLDIQDYEIATLEIINKDCFRRIINQLKECELQKIRELNILDGNSLIEQKDITLILDPYNIDVNDKNFLTKVYKAIESYLMKSEDNIFLLNELSAYISMNFNNLISGYPMDLTINSNLSFKDYLKFLDVKIMEEYQCLVEKIIQLINVNSIIKFSKLLIFVNLKPLLSQEELSRVISTASQTRCPLLLVENTYDNRKFSAEHKLSLDEDLFAIVK